MAAPRKTDIRNMEKILRAEAPRISVYLLYALLIWLFSVLIFLPLANSVNQATRNLVSIIVYLVLIGLVLKTIWGAKKIIDAIAIFPTRRFLDKRKTEPDTTYFLFRHTFYLIAALLVFLLSLPFLLNFHASIAGLVLISLLLWLIYVIIRAFTIISNIVLGRMIEG